MRMNSSRCVMRTGEGHAHWKQKPCPSLCRSERSKEKHRNDACWVENPAWLQMEPPHSRGHMTACQRLPGPQLAFSAQEGLLLNLLSFLTRPAAASVCAGASQRQKSWKSITPWMCWSPRAPQTAGRLASSCPPPPPPALRSALYAAQDVFKFLLKLLCLLTGC